MGYIPYTIFRKTFSARQCTTLGACVEALNYYAALQNDISDKDRTTFQQVVKALQEKAASFDPEGLTPLPVIAMNTRLDLYHKAIILSVELLEDNPVGPLLDRLYYCLMDALELAGSSWDEKKMYSDISLFTKAFTKKEKVVQFLHNIIKSGLHDPKQIIALINQFIKIINILHLNKKISVDLPSKMVLHNISFAESASLAY